MWRENMNNKNKGQDYDRYDVAEESMLLHWLLRNVKGKSRNKLKDILRGHGVYVNGKCITRFDYQLVPGMKVTVSRTKKRLRLRVATSRLCTKTVTSSL